MQRLTVRHVPLNGDCKDSGCVPGFHANSLSTSQRKLLMSFPTCACDLGGYSKNSVKVPCSLNLLMHALLGTVFFRSCLVSGTSFAVFQAHALDASSLAGPLAGVRCVGYRGVHGDRERERYTYIYLYIYRDVEGCIGLRKFRA